MHQPNASQNISQITNSSTLAHPLIRDRDRQRRHAVIRNLISPSIRGTVHVYPSSKTKNPSLNDLDGPIPPPLPLPRYWIGKGDECPLGCRRGAPSPLEPIPLWKLGRPGGLVLDFTRTALLTKSTYAEVSDYHGVYFVKGVGRYARAPKIVKTLHPVQLQGQSYPRAILHPKIPRHLLARNAATLNHRRRSAAHIHALRDSYLAHTNYIQLKNTSRTAPNTGTNKAKPQASLFSSIPETLCSPDISSLSPSLHSSYSSSPSSSSPASTSTSISTPFPSPNAAFSPIYFPRVSSTLTLDEFFHSSFVEDPINGGVEYHNGVGDEKLRSLFDEMRECTTNGGIDILIGFSELYEKQEEEDKTRVECKKEDADMEVELPFYTQDQDTQHDPTSRSPSSSPPSPNSDSSLTLPKVTFSSLLCTKNLSRSSSSYPFGEDFDWSSGPTLFDMLVGPNPEKHFLPLPSSSSSSSTSTLSESTPQPILLFPTTDDNVYLPFEVMEEGRKENDVLESTGSLYIPSSSSHQADTRKRVRMPWMTRRREQADQVTTSGGR